MEKFHACECCEGVAWNSIVLCGCQDGDTNYHDFDCPIGRKPGTTFDIGEETHL